MEKAIKILEKLLKTRCYLDDDLPCYQKEIEEVIKILKEQQKVLNAYEILPAIKRLKEDA